jgi:hypothetical protein
VHLFRPSLSFLAEAQPRHFWQRCTLNLLTHINNFLYSIFYQQLLIYLIYGDRIIIGFVGFVVNLPNRLTDGSTVSVRKSASEKELCFVRLRVRKITVFIKGG